MIKFLSFFFSFLFSSSFLNAYDKKSAPEKEYQVKKVLVATYSGVIIPIAAEYISQAADKAVSENYDMLLIRLDTPGGLDLSMREIIKKILSSKIPVGVFISPKGARAASAGVFITMASHAAAMSPGTNIGAAHPVMIGAGDLADIKNKKEKNDKSPMEEKVLNDASAYIKSIAQQKGRNVEWAVKAVTKSDSISAAEAAEKKVIDFVAEDINDFFNKLNGRNLAGFGKIKSENPQTDFFDMSKRQNFLATITDPNIAMILMSIGAVGIFIELYNPGLILPGIVGAISMILGFYSFQTLSANFAGLALILLGFIFFLIEIKVMSYGLLTIGGIVSVILGTVVLFKNPQISGISVSPDILIVNLAGILAVAAFLAWIVLKSQMRKPAAGIESLAGKKGLAKTVLSPKGKVLVEGELWEAESVSGEISEGEEVKVREVKGFKITVTKI
ncbi:MAG: nodulation protein NfeD [Elusimicrobia bacterium]|nr:nodulation protein NfeD [Elusimicrobiota bacterium]